MKRACLLLFITLWCLPSAHAQEAVTSTIDDQTKVEVTVYNSNLGLVKDVRNLKLSAGTGELRFMDVAAFIMPQTVHARSLTDPEAFAVLEQNYEYDLMNANKLLDKYVGKEIKIVEWKEFQDRKDTVTATLLSNNDGQIFRINDEIYLGYPGYRVLPEIPKNLIAKPTLMWLFDNTTASAQELEVSYLTSNINWNADYVFVINQADTLGDLSGWVTVDNKSGAEYREAKLKLVAGEVHRAEAPQWAVRAKLAAAEALYDTKAQFEEKAFFEYHIYDLQRPTTLKDKQTKQISLLEASGVEIKKELRIYGAQNYFVSQFAEDNPKQDVNVYIKFKNSKENRLGMPLPAGTIRLYKEDDQKSLQFIGEDWITHTPKEEEVKLKAGKAFDVVAERKQLDFQQIDSHRFETEWEITLRNHKEEDIVVKILEPVPGTWKVLKNSLPYEKEDAFTVRFDVPVAKGQEVKVTYRVQVAYY